jgi:hypothetical protein
VTYNVRTDIRVQYYDTAVFDYVDIQADSYEIDIDRGIDIERNVFARPKVGTATVKMSKKSLYDLLNATGPAYKSNNLFRIQYQYIAGGWLNLFAGIIQNFEIQYNPESKKLDITLVANDYMKIGLNTNITSFSIASSPGYSFRNVMAQLGTAVNAIDSRFTLSQSGTAGSTTYQRADVILNVPSGELFTRFLDAELGWMWVDRDNNVKYMTRGDVNAKQATTWVTGGLTVSNVHSTATSHVCMDYMNLTYNSDEIANQVRVENIATGVKTTSTNSTSVTNFGRQLADFAVDFDPTLPSGAPSTYANWATEVANAATPRRLAGVSIPAVLDSGEVSNIVTKEIGDTLQVEFASTGFTTMQEVSIISNINHVITADHWEMNIGLWEGV